METKEKKKDVKSKRGRKPKGMVKEYELNKEQTKFFVDLSKVLEGLKLVFNLLESANQKDYRAEVTFNDIALFALSKLNNKDIEKIQDNSLSEMEKVNRALDEFNKKNNSNLSLGEFLVKKLSIN